MIPFVMSENKEIIPIFYDNSSKKSILTSWSVKEYEEAGADCPESIVKISEDEKFEKVFVVSSNFHTFIPLWTNLKAIKCQLVFGLEILMTRDSDDHSEESLLSNYKIIAIAKNEKGRSDLFKLYSAWKTRPENKYYEYRMDERQLLDNMTNNVIIAYPFFNSPIATNLLVHSSNIVAKTLPDTILFREVNTEHPHEELINRVLDRFNSDGKYKEVFTKSIYCKNRKDFNKLTVYKTIINNDGNYNRPEMPYWCSDAFSFEAWKELQVKS